MTPAQEVGGDLYDFFRLDANRLFFLIGDVAGKGLSASMFMAVSKALYKSTTLRNPHATVGDLMRPRTTRFRATTRRCSLSRPLQACSTSHRAISHTATRGTTIRTW